MKNDRGFSYVELILVLALMAILVGIAGLSYGLVQRTNVNKAASKLDSALTEARTIAMAKGTNSGILEITSNDGKLSYKVGSTAQLSDPDFASRPLANSSSVHFAYYAVGSPDKVEVLNTSIKIKFDQSTGAFKPIDPATGVYCDKIEIYTEKTSAIIDFYTETGKHYTEAN